MFAEAGAPGERPAAEVLGGIPAAAELASIAAEAGAPGEKPAGVGVPVAQFPAVAVQIAWSVVAAQAVRSVAAAVQIAWSVVAAQVSRFVGAAAQIESFVVAVLSVWKVQGLGAEPARGVQQGDFVGVPEIKSGKAAAVPRRADEALTSVAVLVLRSAPGCLSPAKSSHCARCLCAAEVL